MQNNGSVTESNSPPPYFDQLGEVYPLLLSHTRLASSLNPITILAKSTTTPQAAGDSSMRWTRWRGSSCFPVILEHFAAHEGVVSNVLFLKTASKYPVERIRRWLCANSSQINCGPSTVGWGEKRLPRATRLFTCLSVERVRIRESNYDHWRRRNRLFDPLYRTEVS